MEFIKVKLVEKLCCLVEFMLAITATADTDTINVLIRCMFLYTVGRSHWFLANFNAPRCTAHPSSIAITSQQTVAVASIRVGKALNRRTRDICAKVGHKRMFREKWSLGHSPRPLSGGNACLSPTFRCNFLECARSVWWGRVMTVLPIRKANILSNKLCLLKIREIP